MSNDAIWRLKGDSSGAVKSVHDLEQAQKGLASAVEKTSSAWEKLQSFGSSIAASLTPLNQGLELAGKAISAIKTGLEWTREVNELHKLEKAVPVEVFQKLDEATHHLYGKTELLTFASRALVGDLKLTGEQMADVLNASRALADRGLGTVEQNSEKLLKAVQKGGEGMDDFGLSIEKTDDKAKNITATLEKLHGIASNQALDEESKSLAEMNRAFEDLGIALKELVVPLVQWTVTQLKDLIDAIDYLSGGPEKRAAAFREAEAMARNRAKFVGEEFYNDLVNAERYAPPSGAYMAAHGSDRTYYEGLISVLGTPAEAKPGSFPVRVTNVKELAQAYRLGNYTDVGEHTIDGENAILSTRVGEGDFGSSAFNSNALDDLERQQALPFRNAAYYRRNPLARLRLGGDSFAGSADLAGMADPLRDINRNLRDTNTASGKAFEGISSIANAALEAAITGSEGVGKAAQGAASAVLKSLAAQAQAKALWEGAEALGSIAIGDLAGAGAHAAAFAAYEAAAIGIGALSHVLAPSGGGGSRPSQPGGGFTLGKETPANQNNRTIIINMGDGFYGNKKETGKAVAEAIRQAERQGTRDTYTTRFSG